LFTAVETKGLIFALPDDDIPLLTKGKKKRKEKRRGRETTA
jgi:hypothetical protein